MKYLNTREAFLNTINETFVNDITFGGSLLGRLVNSIVRKAKIEINHNKIEPIAVSIKGELDSLISDGLSDKDKETLAGITAKALLDEIYKVVEGDQEDIQKIYQLLDKKNEKGLVNNKGLVNQAIEFLKKLPEGTNLGEGSRDELIKKLENFIDLLEQLEKSLSTITEDQKNEIEEEVIKDEVEEVQNKESDQIESGEESDKIQSGEQVAEISEDDLYNSTKQLLQSVVGIHNSINEKSGNTIGKENNKELVPVNKKQEHPNADNTNTSLSTTNKKEHNPAHTTKALKQGDVRSIEPGHEQKRIGTSEKILNFWNFYSQINEFIGIESPKSIIKKNIPNREKQSKIEEPKQKWNVVNKKINGDKNTNKGEYIDFEEVKDDSTQNNGLWDRIVNAYKKSGIAEHIDTIISLLGKSDDENRKWIVEIGRQVKANSHQQALESITNVISTAIPNSILIISNTLLNLKGHEDEVNKLGEIGKNVNTFVVSYITITKSPTKDQKRLNSGEQETIKPKENQGTLDPKEDENIISDSFNILGFSSFLKINEAEDVTSTDEPTEIATTGDDPNEADDNDVEDVTVNKTVKDAWITIFREGEEKEWKISEQEARRARAQFERAKFQINLVDEDGKDKILKMANLFGQAYKLYTTTVIPSGRPGGRVSNKTFREYLHLGPGSVGTPDNPGSGPWASIRVFNKFNSLISSYIENDEYKKIFNYGTIKRTDGKFLKGNVLLEFIRNMIDENSLKSYDKNRSNLLNKYFGLEISDPIDKREGEGEKKEPGEKKDNSGVLYWNSVSPINVEKNSDIGSFININCLTHDDNKKVKIIAHILQKKEGYLLIKYQFGMESLPLAYGNDIDINRRFTKNEKADAPVYIGLINLQATPIIENKTFALSRRELKLDKDNKPVKTDYKKLEYSPNRNVTPIGKVARQHYNEPMAILTSNDKEGNPVPVQNTKFQAFPNKIKGDTLIDIDQEINDAKLKL